MPFDDFELDSAQISRKRWKKDATIVAMLAPDRHPLYRSVQNQRDFDPHHVFEGAKQRQFSGGREGISLAVRGDAQIRPFRTGSYGIGGSLR